MTVGFNSFIWDVRRPYLLCAVHTVNNFDSFVITKRMYGFVSEDLMLDWHSCQICYPLEIKLLLLLLLLLMVSFGYSGFFHHIGNIHAFHNV